MVYQHTLGTTAEANPTRAAAPTPGRIVAAPLKDFAKVLSRFPTKLVSEEEPETDAASAVEAEDSDDVDALAVPELLPAAARSSAVVVPNEDDELSPTTEITGDGVCSRMPALELTVVLFSRVGAGVMAPLGDGLAGAPVADAGAAVEMAVVGEGVSSTGATVPAAGDNVWAGLRLRIRGAGKCARADAKGIVMGSSVLGLLVATGGGVKVLAGTVVGALARAAAGVGIRVVEVIECTVGVGWLRFPGGDEGK